MTDLTEEVAQALFEAEWGSANTWESECDLNGGSDSREYWLKSAQAAIAIVLDRLREPTPEMIEAGNKAERDTLYPEDTVAIWQAMLERALSPNRSRGG